MREKLGSVCAFFDLGVIRHVERAGGSGQNYFVDTDRGAYLIKIAPSEKSAGAVSTENRRRILPFLARLSEHRFRVVPSLRAPHSDEQVMMAADFTATAQIRLDAAAPDMLTERMVMQIGEELGRLHLVPSGGIPNRITWMDAGDLRDAVAIIRQYYPKRDGLAELTTLAERTDIDWSGLPQSILHGDMFPDNTLFRDEYLVTFIDWDDICHGPSILDFGMAVVGCCFDHENRFDAGLYRALYDGYQSVRPFSNEERAAIGAAVRHTGVIAAIWRFLMWNHHNVGERPHDGYKVFWAQGLDRWEAP